MIATAMLLAYLFLPVYAPSLHATFHKTAQWEGLSPARPVKQTFGDQLQLHPAEMGYILKWWPQEEGGGGVATVPLASPNRACNRTGCLALVGWQPPRSFLSRWEASEAAPRSSLRHRPAAFASRQLCRGQGGTTEPSRRRLAATPSPLARPQPCRTPARRRPTLSRGPYLLCSAALRRAGPRPAAAAPRSPPSSLRRLANGRRTRRRGGSPTAAARAGSSPLFPPLTAPAAGGPGPFWGSSVGGWEGTLAGGGEQSPEGWRRRAAVGLGLPGLPRPCREAPRRVWGHAPARPLRPKWGTAGLPWSPGRSHKSSGEANAQKLKRAV